ncbi:MAG: DUF3617 domain-containing protein [Brevundimonas sp.]
MRIISALAGLTALSLAGCGQGGEAPAGGEAEAPTAGAVSDLPSGPTPGLWRVTTRISGLPGGMTPPAIETCIREAKFEPPPGPGADTPGMRCEQQSFRRQGDAMVGHSVCTSDEGVRTVIDTRVSGDFTRAYTMEVKSMTTPAPTPAMAETTMTMTAERLGDCPAGSASQ